MCGLDGLLPTSSEKLMKCYQIQKQSLTFPVVFLLYLLTAALQTGLQGFGPCSLCVFVLVHQGCVCVNGQFLCILQNH